MASMNLLEALRYLAALDQHRHFGRAAQACHITQPALSNALRALEAELGVALVRRSRQYEGLTAEGELVVAHAHRLLHGTEALKQALASLAGAPQGQLKIGAVPTAVPVAARFAALLHARQPGIRPVVRSMSSQDIEAGLQSLALDLGLGFIERSEVTAQRLEVLPQYQEHHYLLSRTADTDALAFGPPTPWSAMAQQALVLLTPEMHHRAVVERALAEAGVRVQPALETDSVLALVMAVQADSGLAAVLPGALVDVVREHAGLRAQPLVDPVARTAVGWMRAAGAPASQVVKAALAWAGEPAWLGELALHTGALSA